MRAKVDAGTGKFSTGEAEWPVRVRWVMPCIPEWSTASEVAVSAAARLTLPRAHGTDDGPLAVVGPPFSTGTSKTPLVILKSVDTPVAPAHSPLPEKLPVALVCE